MNQRQGLSNRVFEYGDRIRKIQSELQWKERKVVDRIVRRLPTPANVIGLVGDLVMRLGFWVDDPCKECDTSPGHHSSCSLVKDRWAQTVDYD